MKKQHVILSLFLMSQLANAHHIWIRPSSTHFSGDKDIITIDTAASSLPFDVNHRGRASDDFFTHTPDGKDAEKINLNLGKLRTSYDVELNQPGTWHFGEEVDMISFAYKDDAGKEQRWRGSPQKYHEEKASLEGKKLERLRHRTFRVETFATLGPTTEEAIKPSANGLDIEFLTHPNELYADEKATFRLLRNGQPLADAKLELIREDIRYRTSSPIEFTTNANGEFTIEWPSAGMYWLGTSYKGKSEVLEGADKTENYSVTLEVHPI